MTSIPPNLATNAYRIAAGLTNQGGPGHPAKGVGGLDFGSMIKDAVSDVVEKGRVSEQKSVALAGGKADVVDVVTAVAETELALETMVSVRDRVIAAYEEIMRMPI